MKEVTDLITQTAIDPAKGISDLGIEIIKKYKGGSDFWSMSGENTFYLIITILGTGAAALYLLNKGYIPNVKNTTKQ